MKIEWIYCIDVCNALNRGCCVGCHSEEEEGYPSPMLDFKPSNNKHGQPSKINGYGCCIFHDLTRDDWAKIIRYMRKEERSN